MKEIIPFLKKGLFALLSANAAILIFGFASQFFVADLLSVEEMGTIRLLQSFNEYFVLFSALGIRISILKLSSENKSLSKTYLRSGNYLNSYTIAITLLLAFVLSRAGLISNDEKVNSYCLLFALSIIPTVLNQNYLAYFQGISKYTIYSKIQIFTKLLGLLAVIGLTYYYGFNGYISGYLVGSFLTMAVVIIVASKIDGDKFFYSRGIFKKHYKYAKSGFLATLTDLINRNMDIVLISYLVVDKEQIGYYSFTLLFISVLNILNSSVWQMAAPEISKQVDLKSKMEEYKKWHKISLIIFSICGILGILFSSIILKFLFAGKYASSIPFVFPLILGWIFRSFLTAKAALFFGLGKLEVNFYVGLISCIINLPILYYLINNYGVMGAAYGMLSTGILTVIINSVFFYYITKAEGIQR